MRNRPQFRQLSSNSNNDSNESDIIQPTNATILHNNLTSLNEVPLNLNSNQNRLQQHLNSNNYGSKMTDNNSLIGGQQMTSSANNNINSTPSSQQITQQRTFVENRQNSDRQDVVMR